jgi:hypothetical protein
MTAPAAVPLTRAQRGGAWADLVAAGVGEGERNVTLTRLVGHLLARDVDARLVLELAHTVNASRFRPPLDAREVARTVESVAGRELRKRTRAAA